ncbi:MAG TPA: hypothetical protein VER96_02125, partial [Polyangiaceae bacterium]|nr:hypothetical protein [Polyangiaceae bacterium]
MMTFRLRSHLLALSLGTGSVIAWRAPSALAQAAPEPRPAAPPAATPPAPAPPAAAPPPAAPPAAAPP